MRWLLLALLLLPGCARQEGQCVTWCKQYIGGSGWLKTANRFTSDTLPIIMGTTTPRGNSHAVVVIAEDDDWYYFVDNGAMGGQGKISKQTAPLGWIRRQ